MKKFFRIVKDACKMITKNLKSYAFLSVTIVLSLSVLGVYMIYVDSQNFNDNKETIKASPYIVILDYEKTDIHKIALLENKLKELKETYYYTYGSYQAIDLSEANGINNYNIRVRLNVVPDRIWGFYYNEINRLILSDGTDKINLKQNEIIIPNIIYNAIYGDKFKDDPKTIKLRFFDKDTTINKEFDVVNTFEDDVYEYDTDLGEKLMFVNAFIGMSSLKGIDAGEFDERKMTIYSHEVDKVTSLLDGLNLRSYSTAKNDKVLLREKMISESNNKMIIVIALIFFLGVNLYSSFSNTMKERRYEISVRRALGASRIDILIQFFTEGILVMIIDAIVSVAIIFAVLACVKLYNHYIISEDWTIFLSKYTMGMYGVSCVFLSVFFSVIFSIMSTQVEVIKYLKGE